VEIFSEVLMLFRNGSYVYAGGECVEVTDFITGEARLSQLGTTARRMADVIGNNITQESVPLLGP